MQHNPVKKQLIMLSMATIVVGAIFFGYQGMEMHQTVIGEEIKYHQIQKEYYSINKQVRDSAETNSALNSQLVQIQNYPSSLMMLKLVGVGKILTGIFGLLLAILFALMMMPMRLAMIMNKKPVPAKPRPKKKK